MNMPDGIPGKRVERRREPGLTLIELASAMTLGTLVVLLIGNVVVSTTNSIDCLVKNSVATGDLQKATRFIARDLRSSSSSVIVLDKSGTAHDAFTYQVPDPAGATGKWGAFDNGTWKENWAYRYRVNGKELERETLNPENTVTARFLLMRDVDGLHSSVKGFEVTRSGEVYTVRLRTWKRLADGADSRKEITTAVYVTNS
jgi:type II secretory pathway component PulJ